MAELLGGAPTTERSDARRGFRRVWHGFAWSCMRGEVMVSGWGWGGLRFGVTRHRGLLRLELGPVRVWVAWA